MTQQNPSYADWQPTLQRVMTYLVGKNLKTIAVSARKEQGSQPMSI